MDKRITVITGKQGSGKSITAFRLVGSISSRYFSYTPGIDILDSYVSIIVVDNIPDKTKVADIMIQVHKIENPSVKEVILIAKGLDYKDFKQVNNFIICK